MYQGTELAGEMGANGNCPTSCGDTWRFLARSLDHFFCRPGKRHLFKPKHSALLCIEPFSGKKAGREIDYICIR